MSPHLVGNDVVFVITNRLVAVDRDVSRDRFENAFERLACLGIATGLHCGGIHFIKKAILRLLHNDFRLMR